MSHQRKVEGIDQLYANLGEEGLKSLSETGQKIAAVLGETEVTGQPPPVHHWKVRRKW